MQELIRNAVSLAPPRLPESECAFSQDAQMIYMHIHVWEALAYISECQQPKHRDPESLNQSPTASAWTSAWHTVGTQMCVIWIEWERRKRREKKKKPAGKCKTFWQLQIGREGGRIKFQRKKENQRQHKAPKGLHLAGGDGLWPHLLARVAGVPSLPMTFTPKSLPLPPALGCWPPILLHQAY